MATASAAARRISSSLPRKCCIQVLNVDLMWATVYGPRGEPISSQRRMASRSQRAASSSSPRAALTAASVPAPAASGSLGSGHNGETRCSGGRAVMPAIDRSSRSWAETRSPRLKSW